MTDLTQMVANLVAEPATFPLGTLEKTTLAQLHDAVRRANGLDILTCETTEVRGSWFAYGTMRAMKVRRAALENSIRVYAKSIAHWTTQNKADAEKAERERPERELRAALAGASPELLKQMWEALQQFVDNQDETVETVTLVEPLIEKFDAYFAAKAN